MNLTIKINVENLNKIIWPMILLYMVKYFSLLTTKEAFLVYGVIVVMLIGFMKKIIAPRVRGLYLYLFVIGYTTAIGLISQTARNVARDLYYILPTIIMIIMGYYLFHFYKERLSITRTVVFAGAMMSTITFLKMFLDISVMSSFEGIRNNFDWCTYEIVIAFLVIFNCIFISKKRIFARWFQWYSLFIMLTNIILSLTRSAWVETAVGCLILLIVDMYAHRRYQKAMKTMGKVTLVMVLVMVFLIATAPQNITKEFVDKFAKTTEELNSEQEYKHIEDAINNWRGYEIHMAGEQFKKSNIAIELFGAGMGKGIHLEWIPYTWSDMVEFGQIPLLHNAYYTILPKAGILGVIALVWFMLGSVYTGFKYIKRKWSITTDIILLIAIEIVFLIQAYVVRGPIAQDVNLTWCLLVGWINAEIVNHRNVLNKEYREINTIQNV